ncbi:MAG: translation initiation factor IF-2 [Candidatus Omnitrophica bacterium]|nr:translation initiation factor IF-2 [Candidatus Omnitrophota bacterium]
MRVHELAKTLGLTSKDLISQLEKLGASPKNHMSVVSQEIQAALEKVKSPKPKSAKSEESAKPEPVKTKLQETKMPSASAVSVAEPPKEKKLEPAPGVKTQSVSKVPPVSAPEVKTKPAIVLEFPITVGSLSPALGRSIPELIKTLMGMGIFANVNQLLNEEIVFALAGTLGIEIQKREDVVAKVLEEKEDPKLLKPRPPVVTMMGHVDHGKTSLLDAIRKTNVAAKEKGFITQHIGAYGVDIPNKGHVTFLDTPGHEAFTAMRARGANATDVVVLVIAADDGVMPQTIEAYNHAREAGCPVVVAMNKSDLPSANPQRVMTGLQKLGLIPEEWGGKTICVKVSAKTGVGIEQLLEMLLLEAEVLELKANPNRLAAGTVIEGHISKGSGPVATVIVQKGTLRIGDIIVSGQYMGRVRALRNDRGKMIQEAGPSYAAEVSGLGGVPEAGETFFVLADERVARAITEKKVLEIREREMTCSHKHLALEDLYQRITEGNFKELKMIIKTDVQGSAEALAQQLEKMSTDSCRVRVIHSGVGGINESDIMLAVASDAIVIGFHVKADPKAQMIGEKEGVDMRFYNIIYEAVEDVRKAMEGILEPTYKEVIEGKLQVRKIFKSSKVGTIGGGNVLQGKILRSNAVRLVRNNVVVFEGKLASLKRFKDDVREVGQGYECGFSFEGFNDIQENDVLESYRLDKIAGKL